MPLTMRRHYGFSLLHIAVVVLAPFVAFAQPPKEEIDAYPHAQAAGVYVAVIDALFNGVERPGVIVIADSLRPFLGSHDEIRRARTGVDSSTLESLIRITRMPFGRDIGPQFATGPFPRNLRYSIPIHLQSAAESESLNHEAARVSAEVAGGKRSMMSVYEIPFWTAFRKRHPTAWGLTLFTRVGFNEARTEALVQVRHGCGECFSAESIVLRRDSSSSSWRVKARIPHWSESRDAVAQGALRYVGRDARMRAEFRRAEAMRQREVTDSLSRERAPRRIRGTVMNTTTGRPMSGYPIFQMLNEDNNPTRVAVSDPRGKFTYSNPAVGGVYLAVACGAASDPHRILGAAGFGVDPGLDTTIVIDVASLRYCWPRRIRPIQSGEVESGVYATAPFPDARESAVYQTILDGIFGVGETRPLLAAHSIAPCQPRRFDCGGTSHLALLLREGNLDSTTVLDFNRKSGDLIPINSEFAARNELTLLTPSIEKYLIGEAIAATPEQDQHFADESLWYGIKQAYPSAQGMVSFTRIGFDSTGTEALVGMWHERDFMKSSYQTLLLRFSANAWRVERGNLESEPVIGALVGDRCVIARGTNDARKLDVTRLNGNYLFTFVAADGSVERKTLNASGRVAWSGDDWDVALGHLLKIRVFDEHRLSGTWQALGRVGYPIDGKGNRIPEKNGYFCAERTGID